MGVLMAGTSLGVRRRSKAGLDPHGFEQPVPGWGPVLGPWPGRATEQVDQTWVLAVDPGGWPLAENDLVAEPTTGREWLVATADLLRNNLDPSVNYVRVIGHQRVDGDTDPGRA